MARAPWPDHRRHARLDRRNARLRPRGIRPHGLIRGAANVSAGWGQTLFSVFGAVPRLPGGAQWMCQGRSWNLPRRVTSNDRKSDAFWCCAVFPRRPRRAPDRHFSVASQDVPLDERFPGGGPKTGSDPRGGVPLKQPRTCRRSPPSCRRRPGPWRKRRPPSGGRRSTRSSVTRSFFHP